MIHIVIAAKQAPEGACLPVVRIGLAAAVATTAVSASAENATVAAEAGNQKNPDNPFTTAVAAEQAVSASAVIAASASASAGTASAEAVAAAEKQKDNPNPAVASTAIVVLGACAPARVVATTVSSSQIAHCIASKGLLFMVYSMHNGMSMFHTIY